MNGMIEVLLHASGGMLTVLSLCHAQPVDRGCTDKWRRPGEHMSECLIMAQDPNSVPEARKGDRLRCSIIPFDRQSARIWIERR